MKISYSKKYLAFYLGLSALAVLASVFVFKLNLLDNLKIKQVEARDDGLVCSIANNAGPKFSIEDPNGNEIFFINNSGFLGFNGQLFSQVDIEQERVSGYGCNDFGNDGINDNDYYDYRINNVNNISVMAVVYCRQNSTTKVFVKNSVHEVWFGGQNTLNMQGSNQFIITNQQSDSPVAGLDNIGGQNSLVLLGCYKDDFAF